MTISHLPLGPPPFRFVPTAGGVEGPAFSPFFKLLATAIVGGCGAWLLLLWWRHVPGMGGNGGWFVAGWSMMALTWWNVMRSRTRIDAEGIAQHWVWRKHMPLDDLAYCKLVRVPRMEWLIAPRIYARTLMGKFTVFYIASPELIIEADRLRRELQAFRRA